MVTDPTDPTGGPVFVLLDQDGHAQAIQYSPYQLHVTAVYQGTLPEARALSLLAKTRTPAFRRAFQQATFDGGGTKHGDLFYLSLEVGDDLEGSCRGLLQEAPKIVRELVEELAQLWKQLDEMRAAEAYARSAPIGKERLEAIKEAARVRWVSLPELPAELKPIVLGAMRRPNDFHPITLLQHSELLKWCSHGHDLFLVDGQAGHQLTLFQSPRGTTDEGK